MRHMGIGTDELVLLFAIAFLVVGPRDLIKAARNLGKICGRLSSLKNDLLQALEEEEKNAYRHF